MKYTLCVLLFFCVNTFVAQNDTHLIENENTSLLKKNYLKTRKAYSLSAKGKGNEALELALESLEYAKKTNNDSLIGHAHASIGASLYALKDFSGALENTKIAKDRFVFQNKKKLIIMSNNNIGVFYRDVGRIDSSNVYFENALKAAILINDTSKQVSPTYNLGNNYSTYVKDYTKALYYLNKSIKLSKQSNYKKYLGRIYNSFGSTYQNLQNFNLAHFYYDKGIDYEKSNGNLENLSEIYESKIDLYEEEGNLKELNKSLYELIKVKDSMRVINKNDLRKEIQGKYQLNENKEKIKFIEKEKSIQLNLLEKSKQNNLFLAVILLLLAFTAYLIYIKNMQLKTANLEAKRLSKIKSDFYSEISHELRTPLYAVIELSGLLLKESVNAKHKEYLESLKFSGNHLLSLINNVLQLNKVESGKMHLQESNFNLKELIINIIDSLEFGLRDSGNEIVLDYDNTIPQILVGDSLKLSQVFINLISNAIKFTNNGTIKIIINKVKNRKDDDSVKIAFCVEDSGIGIPEDKQDKVFQEFYQELAENENSYKGTGLGLSIVKRTLDAMNSEIRLKSEEGVGTAFFYDITFKTQNAENYGDVISMNELQLIRGYKILIVDDNKINQLVTKKVLDQLDVACKVVGSGAAAIEIVKDEYFDCILMDLHMPVIDGYEASRRIREFNRDITIVALTAASTEEVESRINDYDMNGYVLKPFILNDFIFTITNAVTLKNKFTA